MEWKLFADLAELAGEKEVSVDVDPGSTVEDALEALVEGRPELADRVRDENGELRDHINVLRNGNNVQTQEDGLETVLEAGDELAIFPPVSGGRRSRRRRARGGGQGSDRLSAVRSALSTKSGSSATSTRR